MSLQPPPEDFLRHLFPLYEFLLSRAEKLSFVDPSIKFTSWFRDQLENAAVGGNPESQHLFGFALDATTANPKAVVQLANRLGLVGVEEFDHVHLQLFPAGFLKSFGLFG